MIITVVMGATYLYCIVQGAYTQDLGHKERKHSLIGFLGLILILLHNSKVEAI